MSDRLRLEESFATEAEACAVRVCTAGPVDLPEALEKLSRIAQGAPDALGRVAQPVSALLALVAHRVFSADVPFPGPWRSRLRTALAIEQTRAKAFGDIVGQILSHDSLRRVSPIVMRGAAVAASAYPDGFIRHTSRLTLLVRGADDYADVAAALTDQGCRLEDDAPTGSRQVYRHKTGMAVFVFGGRPCNRMRDFRYDVIAETAHVGTLAGQSVLMPGVGSLWTETVYQGYARGGIVGAQWLVDATWLSRVPDLAPMDTDRFHKDSRLPLPYRDYARQIALGLIQGP